MNIVIQIVCLLALVFAIFAWFLGLMEYWTNLYIHRDNQLRGKKMKKVILSILEK